MKNAIARSATALFGLARSLTSILEFFIKKYLTSKKKRCIRLIRARGKMVVTPEKHTIIPCLSIGHNKRKKNVKIK